MSGKLRFLARKEREGEGEREKEKEKIFLLAPPLGAHLWCFGDTDDGSGGPVGGRQER